VNISNSEKYKRIADLVEYGGTESPLVTLYETLDAAAPPEWPDEALIGEPEQNVEFSEDTLLACSKEPLNDTGNARRLLHLFGEKLLHVEAVGWHIWTGTHWSRNGGDEAVAGFAQRCAALIAAEAEMLDFDQIEQSNLEAAFEASKELRRVSRSEQSERQVHQLEARVAAGRAAKGGLAKRKSKRREFAVISGNTARISGMITQAVPHKNVGPQELDKNPLLFNVLNGTLRFEQTTDSVKKSCEVLFEMHDAGDRLAKIAPVIYDPEAECPRFLASLEKFQPNSSIRRFLQTYHGYSLTGLTGEQCLVFNYGLGANGKSTFVDTIARIMGDYSKTLGIESLVGEGGRRGDQATPDLARLPGARLVRVSEPDGAPRLKEGLIKSLTGGEPMSVRHLNKGFFEFKPEFKLVISGNRKPTIHGIDHGIWRRIKLVPWTVTIRDHEKRPLAEVLDELWAERSGILNWLLEGAIRYFSEGLITPDEIKKATADYRSEQDPLQSFIDACVEIVPELPGRKQSKVQARVMYQAYCRWCAANSEQPWKEKTFGLAFPEKGFTKEDGRLKQYLNVKLHDVPSSSDSSDEEHENAGDEVPF
jgi:putative DNA primase/helicase